MPSDSNNPESLCGSESISQSKSQTIVESEINSE